MKRDSDEMKQLYMMAIKVTKFHCIKLLPTFLFVGAALVCGMAVNEASGLGVLSTFTFQSLFMSSSSPAPQKTYALYIAFGTVATSNVIDDPTGCFFCCSVLKNYHVSDSIVNPVK